MKPNELAAWAGLARLYAASGNAAKAVEANEKLVRPAASLAAHLVLLCAQAAVVMRAVVQ